MRRYASILFALIFTFTFQYGVANTDIATKSPDTQEQEQEGRRKGDQTMMRPDGQVNNASSIVERQESEEGQNDEVKPVERTPEKADSLQDDSVSKYNFIFYFLYKFKYDTEESP